MGLDMFLEKKTYVKNWDGMKPENRHQVTVMRGLQPIPIKSERVSYIIEEVAYWRKANAIHRWFVDNVQGGDDDCKEYRVGEDELHELLSLCTDVIEKSQLIEGEVTNGYRFENGKEVPIIEKGKVIQDASTAQELLPTQDGFFFGSTEYDESYLDDITYTRDVLKALLAEEPDGEYYYSSSW
jgi:hypothetical protein